MKKLMILAALSAMAMGSKADTMETSIRAYISPAESMSAYSQCYLVSATDYTSWWESGHADITKLSNVIYSETLYADAGYMWGGDYLGVEDAEKLTGYSADYIMDDGSVNIAAGTSYAVIYNPTTKDAFGIANEGYNFRYEEESGFSMRAVYSNQKSPYTPQTVPEPTSGLLLVLGVAGLALKRKRA